MKYFCLVLIFCGIGWGVAQPGEDAPRLHYLGLRLDLISPRQSGPHIEYGTYHHRIAFEPAAYFGSTDLYRDQRNPIPGGEPIVLLGRNYALDYQRGGGLVTQYRYVFGNLPTEGYRDIELYVGGGIGFSYVRLSYDDYSWKPFTGEDNFTEYRYVRGRERDRVTQLTLPFTLGFRYIAVRNAYIEFAGGVAYQHAWIQTSRSVPRDYDHSVLSVGYRGIVPRIGLSFGYMVE